VTNPRTLLCVGVERWVLFEEMVDRRDAGC
jgi:hypothetical protein